MTDIIVDALDDVIARARVLADREHARDLIQAGLAMADVEDRVELIQQERHQIMTLRQQRYLALAWRTYTLLRDHLDALGLVLRCRACGASHRATAATLERDLLHAWPRCHGEPMALQQLPAATANGSVRP